MRCGCSHEKTIKRKTSINTDNEHNNVCTCMCTVVRSIGMSGGIDEFVVDIATFFSLGLNFEQ